MKVTTNFFLPILTGQNPLFETHPSPCLYIIDQYNRI